MPVYHPNLLIFSESEDSHVQAVLPHLVPGTVPLICDFSLFSGGYSASVFVSDDPLVAVHDQSGAKFLLDRLEAIWWWRPTPFPTRNHSGQVAEFMVEEHSHFWAGLMAILPAGIRWYNHFQPNRLATRKIFQLCLARECGMLTPQTLVTSCPEEASRFIQSHERVVFKAVYGTQEVCGAPLRR